MTYAEFITKVEREPPPVKPKPFGNIDVIQGLLDNPTEVHRLGSVFTWYESPQGHRHWQERALGTVSLGEADFEYLRGLVNGL